MSNPIFAAALVAMPVILALYFVKNKGSLPEFLRVIALRFIKRLKASAKPDHDSEENFPVYSTDHAPFHRPGFWQSSVRTFPEDNDNGAVVAVYGTNDRLIDKYTLTDNVTYTIGRGGEGQKNHIPLPETQQAKTSRSHATIRSANGVVEVQDCYSYDESFTNGRQCHSFTTDMNGRHMGQRFSVSKPTNLRCGEFMVTITPPTPMHAFGAGVDTFSADAGFGEIDHAPTRRYTMKNESED